MRQTSAFIAMVKLKRSVAPDIRSYQAGVAGDFGRFSRAVGPLRTVATANRTGAFGKRLKVSANVDIDGTTVA